MIHICLLYLIKLIHVIVMSAVVFIPFLVNNIFILKMIILLNITIVLGWYLYGSCFMTDIEYYLENYEEKNPPKNDRISFMTRILINLFTSIDQKYILNIVALIPVISTIICLTNIEHY